MLELYPGGGFKLNVGAASDLTLRRHEATLLLLAFTFNLMPDCSELLIG